MARSHGFPEISCSVINDVLVNKTCHKCLPGFSGLFSESSSSWDSSRNDKIKNTLWYLTHFSWNGTYIYICLMMYLTQFPKNQVIPSVCSLLLLLKINFVVEKRKLEMNIPMYYIWHLKVQFSKLGREEDVRKRNN